MIIPITEKSKNFYKSPLFLSHSISTIGLYLGTPLYSYIQEDQSTNIFLTGRKYEMARPKKDRELQHKHQIMLRLTDTEYEIVSESAKAAHLPLAEYARKQIMQQKVTAKYEIVADLPELKKLIAEFGKIGSNLNQIARHFNSGGIHSQAMRKAIEQSISRIYELKYEVLKMAGDFHGNTETHSE